MAESPTATWFQSEEAYRCLESCKAWLRPFLVQVKRGERLVGSVVGYETRIHAIIFGGPLLAEDIREEELLDLLRLVGKRQATDGRQQATGDRRIGGPIYVEIRNFCDYSRWKGIFEKAGWSYVPHYDIHIDCQDKKAMIGRIHESKMRAVRKANAEGQTITEATSEEQVKQWYKVLKHLYKTKVHRPLWPEAFFVQLWKEKYANLLILKNPNEITGGIFCVQDEKTLYEWYICGSVLVTYGALEYAADKGLKRFDLMGAGEPGKPYGVRDFKMQFGGELKELGRWRIIRKPLLFAIGNRLIGG